MPESVQALWVRRQQSDLEVIASMRSFTVWEHEVPPDTSQVQEYFDWLEVAAAVGATTQLHAIFFYNMLPQVHSR